MNSQTKAKEWALESPIYSFLCNREGRMSLPYMARFLQEIAWRHAEYCGAGYHNLLPKGMMWVLSGLRMVIKDYPSWGEKLQCITWGKSYKGLYAYRDFEMFSDGRCCLLAGSSWLLVNALSHRPLRIVEELQFVPENQRESGAGDPGRIEMPSGEERLRTVEVVYSDLDVYRHVNNTRYIEWCVDTLHWNGTDPDKVKEFEIQFLAETLDGQSLKIEILRQDQNFFFRGLNAGSGKEAFRAKAAL